jgi:hypothetical protein
MDINGYKWLVTITNHHPQMVSVYFVAYHEIGYPW